MKAVICTHYGPPQELVLAEVESPTPGPGQVLIEVKGCGVNFPDTLIIQGKYQFKPALPFSPGCEVAGVVTALGEGVAGVAPGERVMAFTNWGGYAEQVVVAAEQVVPLPAAVDFPTAAGFMLAYGTAYHALRDRAQLQAGETVLVLGAAGGVGLAAVEIAQALGARVIASASTSAKLALCRERGADETLNYSEQDLREAVKDLTDDAGVDVVYDPVGAALAEPALRALAWRGRYLVVGFAGGAIPRVPLNLVLLKGCAIVGVFWGAFTQREPQRHRDNLQQLLAWLTAGKLRPHTAAVYPLAQAASALTELSERRAQGKLVLVP